MEKLLLIFSRNWVNFKLKILNIFSLIILVNFILLIKELSNYTKIDVDKGETPLDVYNLCSSIRETFCLSYAIRKNNNLYLFFQENYVLIKFKGTELRYLGPDERSQALLLEKALNKVRKDRNIDNKQWIKSTPGIFIRRFADILSFINIFENFNGNIFFLMDNGQSVKQKIVPLNLEKLDVNKFEQNFFIIPFNPISEEDSDIIHSFEEVKNIKLVSLSKIEGVDNKILYINFLKDQQDLFKNIEK